MDAFTVHRLKELLIGSSCVKMENMGNYLQIVFGARQLIVESAWRIIQDSEIVVGSASEESLLAKLPHVLVGRIVQSVEVHDSFHDLCLRFDRDTRLEIFADSAEYEHWKLVGGPQEMIIAGPGRLWSSF